MVLPRPNRQSLGATGTIRVRVRVRVRRSPSAFEQDTLAVEFDLEGGVLVRRPENQSPRGGVAWSVVGPREFSGSDASRALGGFGVEKGVDEVPRDLVAPTREPARGVEDESRVDVVRGHA